MGGEEKSRSREEKEVRFLAAEFPYHNNYDHICLLRTSLPKKKPPKNQPNETEHHLKSELRYTDGAKCAAEQLPPPASPAGRTPTPQKKQPNPPVPPGNALGSFAPAGDAPSPPGSVEKKQRFCPAQLLVSDSIFPFLIRKCESSPEMAKPSRFFQPFFLPPPSPHPPLPSFKQRLIYFSRRALHFPSLRRSRARAVPWAPLLLPPLRPARAALPSWATAKSCPSPSPAPLCAPAVPFLPVLLGFWFVFFFGPGEPFALPCSEAPAAPHGSSQQLPEKSCGSCKSHLHTFPRPGRGFLNRFTHHLVLLPHLPPLGR